MYRPRAEVSTLLKSRGMTFLGMLFCLAALATPVMASGTYVLGGLVGAITCGGTYGWDGTSNSAFRTALQTPAYFGPTGTITTTVNTVNITSTATLTGIQGLVVPWWYNTCATATQVNQVVAFFNAGGDLLLSQDDPGNAPVGNALGITTVLSISSGSEMWSPAGALATGPFGSIGANSVTAYYDVSYFAANYGGTVGSTDAFGTTTIYWPKHSFCPTCGALIVTGDTDTWATGATYSPLNADGIFTLNMAAYLIQNSGSFNGGAPATPAPASFWLALAGLLTVALYLAYRNRYAAN